MQSASCSRLGSLLVIVKVTTDCITPIFKCIWNYKYTLGYKNPQLGITALQHTTPIRETLPPGLLKTIKMFVMAQKVRSLSVVSGDYSS